MRSHRVAIQRAVFWLSAAPDAELGEALAQIGPEARARLRGFLNVSEEAAVLQRRIDDLRAFEREYRSRLIAHLERQMEVLRG